MRIGAVTAAPRVISVGDDPVLISPPSLRDLGMLMLFLADHVDPPEGAEPTWRPSPTDPECHVVLTGPLGLPVLLYAAMRRDHPEVRLKDAYEMADGLSGEDTARLFEVVFGREPVVIVDTHCAQWLAQHRASKAQGGASIPLHQANVGAMFEESGLRNFDPAVIAGWSLEQFENKRSVGRGPMDTNADGNPSMTPVEVAAYLRYCQGTMRLVNGEVEPIPQDSPTQV